ncbi:MAG: glutamate--tRNA ligase family protein [Patescibacteria group bacterium]
MFRTRQAPSPTGFLHFGTARTLLFTHYISRVNNGVWYLRLDDTDRNRLQKDAVGSLLESMKQLGLIPDEGLSPNKEGQKDDFYGVYTKGEYGPYLQSLRLDKYHKYAQELINKEFCYWSYVTPEIKEELSSMKLILKKPIDYKQANIQIISNSPVTEKTAIMSNTAHQKMYQSIQEGLSDPQKPDLKFHIQQDRIVELDDVLLGKSKFDLNLEEDFTVIKSDGYPTYHLAHAVDDYLMKTTLNIRAQEWISSFPKHFMLFEKLGFGVPQYMHVPTILGETGNKKMSKRDGNVNMEDWLNKGYLPEAIINYLSFLGWNPGTEKELYLSEEDFEIDPSITLEENRSQRLKKLLNNIQNDFSIEKMQKSPARFSIDKLNWYNKEYMKYLTPYEFSYWSQKIKNSTKIEGDVRVGDYVYVVDTKEQAIIGGFNNTETHKSGVDGVFYPIGGGREAGQTSIQSLLREIKEESDDTIRIKEEELYFIERLYIPWTHPEQSYSGKEMNVYFVERSKTNTKSFINYEDNHEFKNNWADLAEVLSHNKYLSFSIYNEFCIKNNISQCKMNEAIKLNLTAYLLDIPRVTTLIDENIDSSVVNQYIIPNKELIKWKKISVEESIRNLSVLYKYIESILIKYNSTKLELYNNSNSSRGRKLFAELTEIFEKEIKSYLSSNNLDTGSYLWPLRVTLSGKEKSPSPFELLAILPNQEILKRILNVINRKN